MHPRLVLLTIVAGLPALARAESFPLDLFTVQPIAFDASGEITLRGAIHSHHDGVVLDAMTSTTLGASGGLLDVEAGGLRVVWRDLEQHQYRVVATGSAGWACEAAGVASPCLVPRTIELAQARLLTVADFARSLSGEVTVECPGPAGMGARLAGLARAPWEYQLVATVPLIALGGWFWLRRRRRRVLTPAEQIARSATKLMRRLRQGDPVHQRLLVPIVSLVDHARRLERERRRGVAEGWPAETERSTRGLQAILRSLYDLARTLDQGTRAGRATLDDRLLRDLQSDLHLALAATSEADGLLSGNG
jgi:hypothetical protein